MSISKKITLLILVLMCVFSIHAQAKIFNIEDCGINNINVPDEYMGCSLTECDDEFSALLANNNFTFDTWKQQLMQPNKYVLYACDKKDPGKCMYIIFEKSEIQETVTNKDGSKTHKHTNDYNLINDGEEKALYLEKLKEALIFQGIDQDSINDLRWATPLKESVTPYVEYLCSVGSDMIHCYETIYDGNKIKLQFSSKNIFTQAELNNHLNILSEITYSNTVDYTEAKDIISQNTQRKLEEETNSGENTKLIRYLITAAIVMVIVFSLYMAIRTQKKKRKKTIVLREYEGEITEEDDAQDADNK